MINFDPKISGTRVTGSEIDEIMQNFELPIDLELLRKCIWEGISG